MLLEIERMLCRIPTLCRSSPVQSFRRTGVKLYKLPPSQDRSVHPKALTLAATAHHSLTSPSHLYANT
ncbi:hypothetical protein M406DRAFT_102354 [Cryphonectria parasitica EP155]|uniref:Uncharacterized protein n=1 Tax=Cryphonectria parasitica (strain ATCC 38755 / EP155) TaxID=660469 RepID=A0A9P5CND9_CRYP1|nr:uncharacterized protein M406DRAFT_102354 [Cryphonectria parasitica EP155]KAF3765048.1 hypothetical protein M406DRAFT_102354 [Cryphonectria parasitica EP155]